MIIKLEPDDVTILIAAEAELQGGVFVKRLNHVRQHADHWCDPQDGFLWTVESPCAGNYEVTALMNGTGEVKVEVQTGGRSYRLSSSALTEGGSSLFDGKGNTRKASVGWERRSLKPIRLEPGLNTIKLYCPEKLDAAMLFYSLELISHQVRKTMDEESRVMRSDTSWLGNAGYGVMFQWTNRSEPRRGAKKPWPQAVDDFDVNLFTEMILETGAAYVMWTSSWGPQFIPAPIRSVDRLLPGRTSERDLMGEMMDSLGKHGIKLMLYYHSGYDCYHSIDREWFTAMGGYKADKTEFFINFCSIIGEMGERYGEKLAGWFFDGAQRYYDTHYDHSPPAGPGHAPWKRMMMAAKLGNRERIITYNSWIKPRLTEYQDYYAGEGYHSNTLAPQGGNGIFTSGPYQGLQAHTCFVLEKTWGHLERNTDISPPKYTAAQLIEMIRDGMSRKSALSINMEMYEDGSVSPASLELMRQVRLAVRGS